MADVDTPTCRAISARVIPQSSTNFARNLCSDGRNLTPAAPAAQFGQGNFTFFAFFCNQALTLPAGAATFVADSFEKRDDFCIARKFSDEFFHIIWHDRSRFFVDEL
jgi:hypothetical protein